MCSSEQEAELVNCTKSMQGRLFGFTTREIRSLAYELCKTNDFSKPFRNNNEMAGVDWLCGFLKTHPDLSEKARVYICRLCNGLQ
jgi:hypothetical protein